MNEEWWTMTDEHYDGFFVKQSLKKYFLLDQQLLQ